MYVEHSAPAEPALPQPSGRFPGKPLQAWSTPHKQQMDRQIHAMATARAKSAFLNIAPTHLNQMT